MVYPQNAYMTERAVTCAVDRFRKRLWKKTAAVSEQAHIFSKTRMLANRYICAAGTSSTRNVNGLAMKKKKTPQKLMPPAFCKLSSMSELPDMMFLKSRRNGMTCCFISHQASVWSENG